MSGATIVVSGDGRYFSEAAIQVDTHLFIFIAVISSVVYEMIWFLALCVVTVLLSFLLNVSKKSHYMLTLNLECHIGQTKGPKPISTSFPMGMERRGNMVKLWSARGQVGYLDKSNDGLMHLSIKLLWELYEIHQTCMKVALGFPLGGFGAALEVSWGAAAKSLGRSGRDTQGFGAAPEHRWLLSKILESWIGGTWQSCCQWLMETCERLAINFTNATISLQLPSCAFFTTAILLLPIVAITVTTTAITIPPWGQDVWLEGE